MTAIIHTALQWFADVMRSTYTPTVDDPWWADNTAHALGGAAIGVGAHVLLGYEYVGVTVLFLALAGAWEWYEHAYNIRPWDERENWSFDRAIEDTLLDTYVGWTGAMLAVRLLLFL